MCMHAHPSAADRLKLEAQPIISDNMDLSKSGSKVKTPRRRHSFHLADHGHVTSWLSQSGDSLPALACLHVATSRLWPVNIQSGASCKTVLHAGSSGY